MMHGKNPLKIAQKSIKNCKKMQKLLWIAKLKKLPKNCNFPKNCQKLRSQFSGETAPKSYKSKLPSRFCRKNICCITLWLKVVPHGSWLESVSWTFLKEDGGITGLHGQGWPAMSQKLVRLTPNGTNPGLFTFPYEILVDYVSVSLTDTLLFS